MNSPSDEIIKILTGLTAYGHRASELFDDWLGLTEAALLMLPRHAASVQETGQMAEDTAEVQALWARMRNKHRAETFAGFSNAMGVLVQATSRISDHLRVDFFDSYDNSKGPDILGTVYMELCASSHIGQFFTPWSIAKVMANMTIPDGTGEVQDRLRKALDRALVESEELVRGLLTAAILAGSAIPDGNSLPYFAKWVWPHVQPFYEPIMVNDPAVGSGVMLLAASSQFPRWANALGMVRYYGTDIDQTCVRMARINGMLYGYGSPYVWGIAGFETPAEREQVRATLPQVPEPLNGVYEKALEAAEVGNAAALDRLREEARELRQVGLFDFA